MSRPVTTHGIYGNRNGRPYVSAKYVATSVLTSFLRNVVSEAAIGVSLRILNFRRTSERWMTLTKRPRIVCSNLRRFLSLNCLRRSSKMWFEITTSFSIHTEFLSVCLRCLNPLLLSRISYRHCEGPESWQTARLGIQTGNTQWRPHPGWSSFCLRVVLLDS